MNALLSTLLPSTARSRRSGRHRRPKNSVSSFDTDDRLFELVGPSCDTILAEASVGALDHRVMPHGQAGAVMGN